MPKKEANKASKEDYKEQREQKMKQVMETLDNGVKDLANSEAWKGYLDIQKRFRKYSFNNTMLIKLQCPHATYVAGFKTWISMGRQVRKGEKAIGIFAPRFFDKTETDANGKEHTKRVPYYVIVPVFDVSQTDAIPGVKQKVLPVTVPTIKILDGDDMGHLLDKLVEFSEKVNNCPVSFVPITDGSNGCYWHKPKRKIDVKCDNPINQKVKTTVHEIAHSMLHSEDAERFMIDGKDKELEAESTAYIVLGTLGFDTSEYSFGYLAVWASRGDENFHEALKKIGSRVQKCAATILDYLSEFFENEEIETIDIESGEVVA